MRDKLLECGNISLATKDVQVYSADSLDLGTVSAAYTKDTKQHESAAGAFVFIPATDFVAIDGFIPIVQESVDNSTWTPCVTGAEVTGPKAGQSVKVPVPARHARYLRGSVMPKSSGTLTARVVSCGYELGAMDN